MRTNVVVRTRIEKWGLNLRAKNIVHGRNIYLSVEFVCFQTVHDDWSKDYLLKLELNIFLRFTVHSSTNCDLTANELKSIVSILHLFF